MPRSLSEIARKAVNAQQTGECFLFLLEISHATLPDAIRLVNDAVDHDVLGVTYQRMPFEVTLPAETEDAPPRVSLSIDNVDRQLVAAIRSIESPPTVRLSVVLASSPTVIEAGPFEFKMRDTDYDAMQVTGTLSYEDVLNEPYPADSFTPATFPGVN